LFLDGLKLEVMKEVLLKNPTTLQDAILVASRTDTVVHGLAKGGAAPMELGQAANTPQRS